MNTIVLVTMAAALAGGTGLLIAGLRGRRVDDLPFCRRCRFDRAGLPAHAAACPECGVDLRGPRAGRRGRRQRWPVLAACGGLLVAAAAALGGAAAWGAATGFDWNTVKPAWMLAGEVRRGGGSSAAAAAELWTRQRMGALERETLAGLVGPILEHQAGAAGAWDPALADLFIAAWDAGEATDEEALRFVRQGVNIDLVAERRDGGLRVTATAGRLRGGLTPAFFVRLVPVAATIGGEPVDLPGLGLAFALQSALTSSAAAVLPGVADEDPLVVVWRASVGGRGQTRRFSRLGSWEITRRAEIGPERTEEANLGQGGR